MAELRFRLHLTRDEALRYYQGLASTVVVRVETGQTLSFPAHHIRPFIEADGVHGYFSIQFDQEHKLLTLKRLQR